MLKLQSLKIVIPAFITLLCSACLSPAQEYTIRVGYLPATHDSLLFIAQEQGFFPTNLNVKLLKFASSPDILSEMRNERVDLGIPGVAAPIYFIGGGAPFVIIGGAAQESAAVVISKPKAKQFQGVKYPDNLRLFSGLRIGSVKQSTGDALFREVTTNINVQINDSYRNPKDILNDLKGERLDGAVLWSPHMTVAEDDGTATVVLWLGSVLPNHVCCRQVVRADFLSQNEVAVELYLAGLIRAMDFYTDPSHQPRVIEIAQKYIVNPPKILERELYGEKRTKLSVDLNATGIDQYLDAMCGGNLITRQTSAQVRTQIQNGPMLSAYKRIGLSDADAKKAVELGFVACQGSIRSALNKH